MALIHDFIGKLRVAGFSKSEVTAKMEDNQIRVTVARELSAERKDEIAAICGERFESHPIFIGLESQRNRWGFAEIPQVEAKEEAMEEALETPPAARFWLYCEQGGGCDYSIGCGYTFKPLAADSFQEALEEVLEPDEAREELDHPLRGVEGHYVDKAWIVEVAAIHPIDIAAIERKDKEDLAKQKQQEKENEERKQYEKLKAKFGDVS